mmetsp:Transcript_37658/g.77360  ORF Transcript_37658/g.77360 Transcript_37658/m.77360 type:complete len:358 (+) Transcript_37658:49-1122(+)|eukprot:CAMPEP_0181310548 /NCGR_PEP_ID=MMETSP1101-20121128/12644_1 /TAXON_ID=46948 /ORGANISM="Rhodomonas abbreviata, Strain Caron Lab Isolate" /LENGTH=357 /DNA_ID=CAMNT_0023417183 /DNA_START=49 /DNA_END=1122 /DNA_ORIENTATION=-
MQQPLLTRERLLLCAAVSAALIFALVAPFHAVRQEDSLLELNLVPARQLNLVPAQSQLRRTRQSAAVSAARKIVCARTQGLSACQAPKIIPGERSGFEDPTFGENGGQYFENNAGWTASGVLDNSAYAAATASTFPKSDVAGHVREIMGEPIPAGAEAYRGGLSKHCGCTVCPCRGDDDIDTVNNGEWAWPIDTRTLKEPKLKKHKSSSCPKCKYTATVKPVTERYLATVTPMHSSSNKEKVVTKYKTKYITKYKTLYKENTIYVPVYDDPFWNPKDDGRLAGEGVGMPEASPFGAMPYRKGAWYEWGKQRHNMLDSLGGTLDTDQDVDHPADLGIWWADSLAHGRFSSNLDDGDSF